MASVVDRFKKKNKVPQQGKDWTNTGSFINKPARGWLHPDEQLAPDAGVCYGVRYIGSMVVTQSMKTLDFDTRTSVAKESISLVSDAAGLKSPGKKTKRSVKIGKILGDAPNMIYAGLNVNLTITVQSLSIMNMDTGDIIGNHSMPAVSFASGGDADTMDFVAYVAKDENGRACHVLECGGGLAQDVITTIGQAFELRFKMYLARKPDPLSLPDRLSQPMDGDRWGDDEEYYNDRVGAEPPAPQSIYSSPHSNRPVNGFSPEKEKDLARDFGMSPIVYDNPSRNSDLENIRNGGIVYDNSEKPKQPDVMGFEAGAGTTYDNRRTSPSAQANGGGATGGPLTYDNRQTSGQGPPVPPRQPSLDAFDMSPFNASVPSAAAAAAGPLPPIPPPPQEVGGAAVRVSHQSQKLPYDEEWFHGKVTRQQCDVLLIEDGDFLVRESVTTPGQFVLSGKHSNMVKHLLLVDPEGVVRTKDRTFNSVSHLINYHKERELPITSTDSELLLRNPIVCHERVL